MAREGIFSSANRLVTTTLRETESTVYSGLSTVSSGMAIMPTIMEELHNDSKEELVDSRLRLAIKKAEVRDTLKNLGYSNEAIEAILHT